MLAIKQSSSPLFRLVRITWALRNGHKYKIINILRLHVEPGLNSLSYTPSVEPLLIHFVMTGMCGLPTGDAHQSGLRHERGRRLWFDVSEVPAGERIVSAELRLFRSEGSAHQRATVSVYQLAADERGWVLQPIWYLKCCLPVSSCDWIACTKFAVI
jgi:hypothetical protein